MKSRLPRMSLIPSTPAYVKKSANKAKTLRGEIPYKEYTTFAARS